MIHDPTDLPLFHVALKHDAVDAGGTAILRGRLSTQILTDPTPVEVVVTDAEGAEIARARFVDSDDGWHQTNLIRLRMPDTPGEIRFHASLQDVTPDPTDDGAEVETYADHDFTVTTTGHSTQIVVWDMPPSAEHGSDLQFRVGLRCSCGCAAAGWTFTVHDAAGTELATGITGDTPWTGTDGLYPAVVTLTVPATGDDLALTVCAQGPAAPLPHAAREETRRLRLVAPAMHEIRVTVTDAETGAPIPRAKVVAHPYRTLADAEGRATLRVAPGVYTVFASGTKHFAFKTICTVADDIDIHASLHLDRELTHQDLWS